MNRALFVELTDGRVAVHVALEARIEVAALCSELQAALHGLLDARDSVTDGLERELYAKWLPAARAALARAKGAA